MDAKVAAKSLDGREYRDEQSNEFFEMLKESGLVAVFGASDDLIEFRGAIEDEVGAYDGGAAYLTGRGLFEATCDNEHCPHEKTARRSCRKIEAIWCPKGDNVSWAYRTDIPHETFTIMEDGEPYCRGIVFALADAA